MKLSQFIRKDPIALLTVFLPIALLAEVLHWGDLSVFILAAIGIIPMAHYIGESTEALAVHTGPRMGALLNATLGNAAELIITIFAIREGLLELVKASITGSILGNLLLVLGMSMVVGGLKHGWQKFGRKQASNNAILLALAVIALVIPSLLGHYVGVEGSLQVEALSIGVAVIMIALYVLGLLFNFSSQRQISVPADHRAAPEYHGPDWSKRTALIVLGLSTVGVAVMSELLVGAVGHVVVDLGISEFFLGIILIPLVGNVAEHLVAVQVAAQNKMDLSVEISVASSLQIALFVAPVLVFISLVMGNPLTLVFNQIEVIALVAGVFIAAMVSMDGESNWIEGAGLLAIYAILALTFFLIPA